MSNITILILAAGKSTRFKSKESKIFNDLAGIPIIDHIYYTAKKISNEIIFVCNNKNIKNLQSRFKNCKFAIQKKQKGTADAVLSAKKFIKNNSNVLILFGDVPLLSYYTLRKLVNNFKNRKLFGSMLAFNTNNPFSYGRVITDGKNIKEIIEEVNASSETKKVSLCNSGVMICSFKILYSFIKDIKNNNKKKEKYLPDIFKICYKNNKSFQYILCDEEEMLGINTLNDYNKIDEIYQIRLKRKLIKNGVKIINPKSVRVSYDTKIGKNSIIEPYVFIQKGVQIKSEVLIKSHTIIESSRIGFRSSIGPFARIRPQTIIGKNVKIGNYVEIKKSKIGDNCSISHLSYIGDSQLGKNINIGAGTITCNYDGKKKNQTIIRDNVFVGSNTSIVAPVTIGNNSTIGAGSVITKNIPSNSLSIERNQQINYKKKLKK
tara:strand:- start:8037 stop:9335 length:1299 start_codon:yes stop_codon:yes gene_type:complete